MTGKATYDKGMGTSLEVKQHSPVTISGIFSNKNQGFLSSVWNLARGINLIRSIIRQNFREWGIDYKWQNYNNHKHAIFLTLGTFSIRKILPSTLLLFKWCHKFWLITTVMLFLIWWQLLKELQGEEVFIVVSYLSEHAVAESALWRTRLGHVIWACLTKQLLMPKRSWIRSLLPAMVTRVFSGPGRSALQEFSSFATANHEDRPSACYERERPEQLWRMHTWLLPSQQISGREGRGRGESGAKSSGERRIWRRRRSSSFCGSVCVLWTMMYVYVFVYQRGKKY